MEKKAVFAGSFDPFTLGHLEILQRGLALFSEITVLVAFNPAKQGFLLVEDKLAIVRMSVRDLPNVKVESWSGLTTEFLKQYGTKYLLRGIRGSMDLPAEQSLEWANQKLFPEVETVYLHSSLELSRVSSSLVREMLRHRASVRGLVAPEAVSFLESKC